MPNKKGSKYLTDVTYSKIKQLVEAGLTVGQTAKFLNVSWQTVKKVKNSYDFDDYKEKSRAYVAMIRARHIREQGVNIPLPEFDKKESEKIETPIYDVLVEIRNEIKDTNRLIALMGKSKSFKLF